METKMNIIECPYCKKGILFAVEDIITKGKIEGVCKYCRTKMIYDAQTQNFQIVKKQITNK